MLGVERDAPRAALAGRARNEHERVAEQAPERVAGIARDRRRDEAVRGARQQWHLLARGRAQRVGVAVAPVCVDERAVAQVANARRAAAQEVREHARLGQRGERCRSGVHALLERRAEVRRAERDHMPNELGPAPPARRALVARAARDQPAHRVSDERDLVHGKRPRVDHLREQRGQRSAVFGDVKTAVVAHVQRRAADVAREPGAVRVVRVLGAPLPVELRPHQAVQEDDETRARVGKGNAQRIGVRRDGLAVDPQRDRLVKLALRALEPVADEPVQRGDQRAALWRPRQL